MERHPEYKYCIKEIKGDQSEAWIFIGDNDSGWEEELFDWTSQTQYDGPIEFIKRIQDKQHWTIKDAGELQYSFEEDPNHLIFQMDDLFGFVILTNAVERIDEVTDFINKVG